MIILIGPDSSGKTTLAKQLEERGLDYLHFTRDSNYSDYIEPLCKLEMSNAVLDRHGALCEHPYSVCMGRPFKFNLKHWHNLLTMTLIQNPVIVLCTHKPSPTSYPAKQYLPYELWDRCLFLYKELLTTHYIPFTEFDYAATSPKYLDFLLQIHSRFNAQMDWWREHWVAGYGCAGSPNPQFLLVAERIGPNNVHNIPFETGPTGAMLSNMLAATGTPIGKFTVTNMIKSFRRDTRQVNARDVELLEEEISHLKPKKVIFMGSPARRGIPVAKALGCEVGTIVHLGSLNYAGIKDMSGYYREWAKMIGLLPTKKFKEV